MLLVSRSGVLTFANLAARALFGIGVDTLGRPFGELRALYRPADLRGPVEEAVRERRRVTVGEVRFAPAKGEERRLEVTVRPLLPDGGAAYGASVVFNDTTRYAALERELEGGRRDLELAYEELQSTIDELETTNEELQSANEELQTTNEELQSTNEELETMNEELQSTNEELETINDELRDRTVELDRVQRVPRGDPHLARARRRGPGPRAPRARLEPARRGPVGPPRRTRRSASTSWRSTSGSRPSGSRRSCGGVLGGKGDERAELEMEAVNRRGRAITCAATVMRVRATATATARRRGAIVLMRDAPPTARASEASRGRPSRRRNRSSRCCRRTFARCVLVADHLLRAAGGLAQLLDLDRGVVAQPRQGGAQLGARRARDRRLVAASRRDRGATTETSGSSPASAPISRRRIGTTRRASPEGRPTGSPRSHQVPLSRRISSSALGELGDGGRDRRAARADELSQHAVRERQRHEHAVARHAPPAVGEMPEQREDPAVDAVELRDRLRHRQSLRALVEPVDEDGVDLRAIG